MHERDVELFNDSIERCSGKPDFLRRFYTLFLASSDTVARKFEHTDMRRQARMLKTSLYIMMLASGDPERIVHLERLARLHSRAELDIKPELYDVWLDRLVQAVSGIRPDVRRGNRDGVAACAAAGNRIHEIQILTCCVEMRARYLLDNIMVYVVCGVTGKVNVVGGIDPARFHHRTPNEKPHTPGSI